MTKRVIPRASKMRLSFFGVLCVISIVSFFLTIIFNICTIYDLKTEKKNLENLYVELQDQAETLKIDIEKFSDKNYLANYAREHYKYSKDGEYIIQISKEEISEDVKEDISKIKVELNKNYVVIGLCLFIVFMFTYILFRGKKKKL